VSRHCGLIGTTPSRETAIDGGRLVLVALQEVLQALSGGAAPVWPSHALDDLGEHVRREDIVAVGGGLMQAVSQSEPRFQDLLFESGEVPARPHGSSVRPRSRERRRDG
jgi:hypothetical protein